MYSPQAAMLNHLNKQLCL